MPARADEAARLRSPAAGPRERGRRGRAARLLAIKADIARNLGGEGLTVGAIARRHGLTPRYVQMLFKGDGTTFSRFVLCRRIERARRMLTHPGLAACPISTIAYRVGFGDLSYFNRSFRRICGATPSEIRGRDRPNWPRPPSDASVAASLRR